MAVELAKKLRDHTRSDAIESYHELKEAVPTMPDYRRMGLATLDFFFLHHRIKAKTKHHISFYDAIKDKELNNKLKELVIRYKKRQPSSYDEAGLLKAQYQVFQLYYGTINQFRPIVAKWVYQHFQPKHGILDFSAGWGGRALAALSLGIPYTGIDANQNLEASYRKMIETVEPDPSARSPIQLHFQPSETVDFSKFNYDLIFTSPPYFMIEEYEKMPKYKSKEEFLERFFVPVALSAWKNLRRKGHMALNMPEEMFDAIKDHLPKTSERIKMPLSNRHPSNAAKGQALGEKDKIRFEIIYVWTKN
jgi:16S rRNA G966 N2-methylase RsmD